MSETPMETFAAPRPPSRLRYLWSVVILLAGLALFLLLIVKGVRSLEGGFARFVAPGEQTMQLEPSTYTVFYEHRSVLDGKVYSTPQTFPPLQLTVTDARTGQTVPVTAGSGSANYQVGGREGKSVLAFTVPSAGSYVVRGEYAGQEGPELVLAVSNQFGKGLVVTILGGLAVCFGSLVLAVVVIVLVYRARRRAAHLSEPRT